MAKRKKKNIKKKKKLTREQKKKQLYKKKKLKSQKKKNASFQKQPKKKQIKKPFTSKRKISLLLIFFFIFFLSVFAFSIYKIISWKLDNDHTEETMQTILEKIVVEEVPKDSTTMLNAPKNKEDVYFKYKDTPLINVDIQKLKKENEDTVGWIQVPGTSINYPVVQASDNAYYLNHDFQKQKNSGGWIFLDYRNQLEELGNNTILYGHERFNHSMFGTLKNVLNPSWQSNTDNHVIKISSQVHNYLFQVFSIYTIPNENYYLKTDFADEESYQTFLNTIFDRSAYSFQTTINTADKILTLSTCDGNKGRLVVHAKLIKISEK